MKKKKAVSKIAHGKLAKSAVFKGKKDSKQLQRVVPGSLSTDTFAMGLGECL